MANFIFFAVKGVKYVQICNEDARTYASTTRSKISRVTDNMHYKNLIQFFFSDFWSLYHKFYYLVLNNMNKFQEFLNKNIELFF